MASLATPNLSGKANLTFAPQGFKAGRREHLPERLPPVRLVRKRAAEAAAVPLESKRYDEQPLAEIQSESH
jgi:hypothetical protein